MFELDKNIENWVNEFKANQSMQNSDIDELESHLRDSIAELQKKGLSPEESFWVARQRLGDTTMLVNEFAHVNRALLWRKRIFWLLSGYFLVTTISYLAKFCALPIHFISLPWLSTQAYTFNVHYFLPVSLFIFVLFVAGAVLMIIATQKDIVPGKRFRFFHFFTGLKVGYKFVFILLGFYLFILSGKFFSLMFLVKNSSPAMAGNLSEAEAFFSILWNAFLFITLVIFTIQLQKNKHESVSID
ncbi:MAG TPA: permease prefix domain 1-containing protein [bacterium]|nr:permease prefix domain 1-containing protein [bacterium]HPN46228.1 permease prefix domain 1-containing protein [bacterium]